MHDELLDAVSEGDVDRARLLLQSGSSPDEDPWGLSLLDEALARNDEPMARVLVEHGARLHETDERGRTRLHRAAAGGDDAVAARLLLGLGLDSNGVDRDGWTPLHHAAAHGHGKVVDALLEAGAARDARTHGGQRPVDLARLNGHGDLSL